MKIGMNHEEAKAMVRARLTQEDGSFCNDPIALHYWATEELSHDDVVQFFGVALDSERIDEIMREAVSDILAFLCEEVNKDVNGEDK